jgi:aminoglycoside phosphotransferase (APT) family kinase protein
MLQREDADLALREPALAGMALLLDTTAFMDLLQEHFPAAAIQGIEAVYARYKPGTSYLGAYRVQLPIEQVWVTARAYPTAGTQKLQKIARTLAKPGPLGAGAVVLQEQAIAITVFPNDRKLCSLAHLAETEKRLPLLQALLPDEPAWWDADWSILRYKPERRCVAQLESHVGQALLKVYNSDDFENAARAAGRFCSRGNLRMARRLAVSGHHYLIVTEWLPGQPLDLALYSTAEAGVAAQRSNTGDLAPGTLCDLAAALADLHNQQPNDLQSYSVQAEAMAIYQAAGALAALVPSLGMRPTALAEHLAGRLAQAEFTPCAIHGDFSADQVIRMPGGVWGIVDLDAAGAGDPMADVGAFVAQLYQETALSRMMCHDVRCWCDELVEGYQQATPQPFEFNRFRTHLAARLLRLAVGPFRKRIAQWDVHAATIFQMAEEFAYDC